MEYGQAKVRCSYLRFARDAILRTPKTQVKWLPKDSAGLEPAPWLILMRSPWDIHV